MPVPNVIDNGGPGGGGGAGSQGAQGFQGPQGLISNDIFAATRVVDLGVAGTDADIQDAVDNLPAEGGEVFLKQGVYALTVGIVLPDKPVKFVGAGRGATVLNIGSNVIAAFDADVNNTFTFVDFDIESDGVSGQIAFDVGSSSPGINLHRVRATTWRVIEAGASGSPSVTAIDCQFPPVHLAGGVLWNGQGIGEFLRVAATTMSDFGGFSDGGGGAPSIRAISCDFALGIDGTVGMFRAYGCTFGRGPIMASQRSEFVGCDFIGGFPARWIDLSGSASRSRIVGCAFTGHTGEAVRLTDVTACIVSENEGCNVLEAGGADYNNYANNYGFADSILVGADSRVDSVQMGISSDPPAEGIGKANLNTTAVGNAGSGEDNLITYSLPANALYKTASAVRIKAWGTTDNNANAKTLKLYFGTTVVLTYSLTANQAGLWEIEAIVGKTGSNTQDYHSRLLEVPNDQVDIEQGTAAETDTAAITIKCTGEATANGDIVQNGMLVEILN